MLHPELAELLERRIEIIADHSFRDRDPDAHLEELKSVSEKISKWHQDHQGELNPRLEHFLQGSSYEKAHRFLESEGTWSGH